LLNSDTIKYIEIDNGVNTTYKYILNNILDELYSSDDSNDSSCEEQQLDSCNTIPDIEKLD
jgi:hypothetical protein